MKAEFTIKHSKPDKQLLYVKGDLTTQWAGLFKEKLMRLQELAMKRGKDFETVISLQEVTAIDTSALQLLYVFRTLMEKVDRSVSIVSPDLPALVELITKSGWNHILLPRK